MGGFAYEQRNQSRVCTILNCLPVCNPVATSRRWDALADSTPTNVRRGVLQVIESWRCDGVAMGPNARVRPTVTPVQRSNGASPTPNPRGVKGRDLLLWQGQRQARAKGGKHSHWYRGFTSLNASAWASSGRSPATVAALLVSIFGVIALSTCSWARARVVV